LAAAFETVAVPKLAHSLHAHFLKTGQPGAPIGYTVERLRDGRNYAARVVRATQGEHALMLLTTSFKLGEPGDRHQPPMPEVPAAVEARRHDEAAGRLPLALPFTGVCGIELVPVDGWRPSAPPGLPPAIALWMRADLSPAADARARQRALAYLSDGTLIFNALRPHGNAFLSHRATSLDHALWFHDDADPSDWLLFDQSGPVAVDSRGLNHGTIFDRHGRLLASTAQEAMMRRN
jgi:acyl-CoA thioesterase-2